MEKYIGRKMLGFYNVDLCDKKAMMDCFSKVESFLQLHMRSVALMGAYFSAQD